MNCYYSTDSLRKKIESAPIPDAKREYYYFIATYIIQYDIGAGGRLSRQTGEWEPYFDEIFMPIKKMKIFCKDYNWLAKIYRDLEEWGVIHRNNHYIVGSKSKACKLTDSFKDEYLRQDRGHRVSFDVAPSNKTLCAERFNLHIQKTWDKVEKKFKWAKRLKDDCGLIDIDAREASLETDRRSKLNGSDGLNTNGVLRARMHIERIQFRDHSCIYDWNNGRIYNPIVLMNGFLRKYLKFQGKNLVNIDIKCCQPLLLANLYSPILDDLQSSFSSIVSYSRFSKSLLSLYHYESVSLSKADVEREREEFIFCCNHEDIYNFLNEGCGRLFPEDQRKELKEMVFKNLIFGKIYPTAPKVVEVFRGRFPILWRLIEGIKEDHGRKGGKERYKQLSWLMQRAESRVMVDQVLETLQRAIDGPVIPIHDSIVVLPEHAFFTKKVIEEVFMSEYSLPTILREECLSY